MAGKKYYIRVPEELVEVSEEVYKASRYMDRQYKTIKEKDSRNHVCSYDAFDTDDMTGAEMIPDQSSLSVEDRAIARIMSEKLKKCLYLLSEEERALIISIFYEGLSEEAAGQQLGISQPAINKRKKRILKKLRKMFNR